MSRVHDALRRAEQGGYQPDESRFAIAGADELPGGGSSNGRDRTCNGGGYSIAAAAVPPRTARTAR